MVWVFWYDSSTMYYSFNNTRLNFLYLFPIIMSHSEKSEYMAPLLKVWLSFYTNMHVYSCCMFAHALLSYPVLSLCFIKVSFYLRWRLWNNNLPKTDRQDFKKQQIRFSIWITCSLHTLLSSPRDFRVYKVTKAASAHSPTDNISHNALKPSLWTVIWSETALKWAMHDGHISERKLKAIYEQYWEWRTVRGM